MNAFEFISSLTTSETPDINNIEHGGPTQVVESQLTLSVWAPHATAVSVVGDFNDWNEDAHPMLKDERPGHWVAQIPQLSKWAKYQFVITTPEGEKFRRNDPRSRALTNSDGCSLYYPDDFEWSDAQYTLPAWNEVAIYELHIGSFNVPKGENHGTFDSAIEKLGYLKDLGINTIELMPINEFPGDFSWGYNPSYPFSVEESYGGPDGLKRFIKAAHEHDIGVILDVVYNHFGPSDLHLWQFDGWSENGKGGIYFYNDWRSNTPWGDTRPDYGREEVRDYIFDNAMMWLEEFRVDGLRMDMVPYLRNVSGMESDGDSIPEGYDLIKRMNHEIASRWPNKLVIAEDLHGNEFITEPTAHGGCGFGAQWDADFVHPIRQFLTEADNLNRDIFSIESALLRRYNDDAFKRVVYVESHDAVANGQARIPEEVAPGNTQNDLFSKSRSLSGAVLTLTAPGIPMLFQGQEFLEDLWFSDDNPLSWDKLENNGNIFDVYSALLKLRVNSEHNVGGLNGQYCEFFHLNNEVKSCGYLRWKEAQTRDGVAVAINFANGDDVAECIQLPEHIQWEPVLFISGDGLAKFEDLNFDAATKKVILHGLQTAIFKIGNE